MAARQGGSREGRRGGKELRKRLKEGAGPDTLEAGEKTSIVNFSYSV